jgi:hypothetical protein
VEVGSQGTRGKPNTLTLVHVITFQSCAAREKIETWKEASDWSNVGKANPVIYSHVLGPCAAEGGSPLVKTPHKCYLSYAGPHPRLHLLLLTENPIKIPRDIDLHLLKFYPTRGGACNGSKRVWDFYYRHRFANLKRLKLRYEGNPMCKGHPH